MRFTNRDALGSLSHTHTHTHTRARACISYLKKQPTERGAIAEGSVQLLAVRCTEGKACTSSVEEEVGVVGVVVVAATAVHTPTRSRG